MIIQNNDTSIILHHGDCLDIMNNMPSNSIDCIVTSPPYNKKWFSKQKHTNQIWKNFSINYNSYDDNMPIEDYERWMKDFLVLSVDKLKDTGSLFFNHKPIRHNNTIYHPIKFIIESGVNIRQEIIWNRKNSPNIRNDILLPCTERVYWITKGKPSVYRSQIDREYISEVWDIQPKRDREHPASFPSLLAQNCIELTTKEGDTVLDPFMGVASTAIACIDTNRNFIGIEIDEEYINISQNRIHNHIAN